MIQKRLKYTLIVYVNVKKELFIANHLLIDLNGHK